MSKHALNNFVQFLALIAFAFAAIKTCIFYQTVGLSALVLNGNLLLMSGFFCLFALTYAHTHPIRATMAAAGSLFIAALI